jgi:hypothetical protein
MKRYTTLILISVLFIFSGCIEVKKASPYFEINNTNLAPNTPGHPFGTGARINGVTYHTNDTAIELFVFSHASAPSNTAEIVLNINGTNVSYSSGRPLGGAEESSKQITAIIPSNTNYTVYFYNYHHYEWREYKIIGIY